MLHATLVLAAEAADHEEPSKTAFYILGGLLALWAVAVSAVGISRHEAWPSSAGAARGVMGATVLLVACAIGAAIATG